jgi:3-isopropylmalate/(R)-2-methylmalate dehydratase small subunit
MKKICQVSGRAIPLLLDDVDTDRIIPARFLRCVTFDGLGEHAFEDDRQQDPGHPFNDPRFQGAAILLVGRNFGCGSSREHAPQALIRWGIQAVVGVSFAEIFFGNCISNGVPCVTVPVDALMELGDEVLADPALTVEVDLERSEVRCRGRAISAGIPAGPRQALMTGQWDFLGQLVEAEDEVRAAAARIPYLSGF